MLGDVSRQLSNFNFISKFSFETCIENLSLRWFQAIHDTGNRTKYVCTTELNKFVFYKIRIRHDAIFFCVYRWCNRSRGSRYPILSIARTIFRKCHIDHIPIIWRSPIEGDTMTFDCWKVLSSFLRSWCTQTLVVLYFVPILWFCILFRIPCIEFILRVERDGVVRFIYVLFLSFLCLLLSYLLCSKIVFIYFSKDISLVND